MISCALHIVRTGMQHHNNKQPCKHYILYAKVMVLRKAKVEHQEKGKVADMLMSASAGVP